MANRAEGTSIPAAQLTSLLLALEDDVKKRATSGQTSPEELRRLYLGTQGEFTRLSKFIRLVPAQDRQQVGRLLNEVKQVIEVAIAAGQRQAKEQERPAQPKSDVTIPGHIPLQGHLHPTTLVVREMNRIFQSLGFSVADGREIETDEYNFDRTNLPPDHPARDLQDALYIQEPIHLLRTHTSSVESHILATAKPPYRFVIPGKVYRNEKANVSNNIMFYQYQGLAVGTDISMAELKGTLNTFVRQFFGPERATRFRCKYYPEVEPGVGVDIDCVFCHGKGCAVCKGRGWIEMLGAGMIHPNMLRRVGLDPSTYTGFAWGMGLDRIVMTRYGISDIRSLYNGDIGYREQ
jgi:phenylalanyl-tRNA synthetase alpha chain